LVYILLCSGPFVSNKKVSHTIIRIVPANDDDNHRNSAWAVVWRIVVFVVLQNLLFYLAHRAMHSTPYLYWIHKYHHRYNTYVTPSSANAVSPMEFLLAYIVPPALVLLVVQPSPFENKVAMNIIAHCSTLVHTPGLENWCARNLPSWWVGPDDHIEHHRRLTKNYAAPCLNLDYLLGQQQAITPSPKDTMRPKNN
jgi:sterol desaturase/sphingolipid hydroxylase (fatty acid hydroxylase superfamily)